MPNKTQPSDKPGLTDGASEPGEPCLQNSTSSDTNSNGSTPSRKRYRQPVTPLQLAAQASAVATNLLNGSLDLETARAYSAIARVAAQALSTEVQTGRFLKSKAQLTMDTDGVWEDES